MIVRDRIKCSECILQLWIMTLSSIEKVAVVISATSEDDDRICCMAMFTLGFPSLLSDGKTGYVSCRVLLSSLITIIEYVSI